MNQPYQPSEPPGAKVLLMGGSGSGKTYSIASLASAGISVRYLWLEDGFDSTMRYFADRKIPVPANMHWQRILINPVPFKELMNTADLMNTLTFSGFANWQDPNRGHHRSFYNILGALASYKCERTGASLGSAEDWGPDCALVIDSLSALSDMAFTQLIGNKPLRDQGMYGIAQQAILMLLNKLTSLRCHFVLTAHIEREADEINQTSRIMVATIGKKLPPRVPTFFSDVIHAKRDGTKFSWNTNTADFDLKTRLLPIAGGLEPSFIPLIAEWKRLRDHGGAQPAAIPIAAVTPG